MDTKYQTSKYTTMTFTASYGIFISYDEIVQIYKFNNPRPAKCAKLDEDFIQGAQDEENEAEERMNAGDWMDEMVCQFCKDNDCKIRFCEEDGDNERFELSVELFDSDSMRMDKCIPIGDAIGNMELFLGNLKSNKKRYKPGLIAACF